MVSRENSESIFGPLTATEGGSRCGAAAPLCGVGMTYLGWAARVCCGGAGDFQMPLEFALPLEICSSNFQRLAIRAVLALLRILHFHTCCKAKKRTGGRHDMHHSRMAVVSVWRDQT